MKFSMLVLLFLVLFSYQGSWTENNYFATSVMVLRFDGTATMYMNIGDPRAHVWEGYWKEDEGNLFLLDSFKKPLTVGFPTARYEIRMRIFNEMHYFHRTGDEQGNGNL